MIDLSMHIEGDLDPEKLLERFGLQENGPVQTAIDTSIVEYMKSYWAYDTGQLANCATGIGTGIIEYDVPYAWEMYYGQRANGSPVHYRTDKNPLAGAYPFERMLADHYDDIIEEAKRVAGSQ